MSPASYLTAPPRAVAGIVATLVTLVSMWDWAIWAALILAGLTGIAALVLLALGTRRVWRAFKKTRRAVVDGLADFAAKAETVADKVAATGDTAELQESLGRLRVSLARLAVLRAALDEAQDAFGRVTEVVPRR